tara:strand:- start:134 stop:802 length:669 start_codon:yes stop_codon:yes gene_type:complete
MDYLDIKYNKKQKPITNYPKQFAEYNFNRFNLKNKKVLEIGSGRGEFSNNFSNLGVDLYTVDINDNSKKYLNKDIIFEKCNLDKDKLPFEKNFFDVVYSKSVIEHLNNPENFFLESKRVLKKDGLLITYTPDWDSQYKNFFDDTTHIKPYSIISIEQGYLNFGYNFLFAEKFYQLPIIWKFPILKFFCKILSFFIPIRSKIKFLRFSKELMILAVGKKDSFS